MTPSPKAGSWARRSRASWPRSGGWPCSPWPLCARARSAVPLRLLQQVTVLARDAGRAGSEQQRAVLEARLQAHGALPQRLQVAQGLLGLVELQLRAAPDVLELQVRAVARQAADDGLAAVGERRQRALARGGDLLLAAAEAVGAAEVGVGVGVDEGEVVVDGPRLEDGGEAAAALSAGAGVDVPVELEAQLVRVHG